MIARVAVLGLLVVASALAVVYTTFRSRALVADVHNLRAELQEHDAEYGRLELEQRSRADHSFIEFTAKNRLGMSLPDPEHTKLFPR